MPDPADLVEFLKKHSDFEFHLCEYVETAPHLPGAWLEFRSFCERFGKVESEAETQFEIFEAARAIPAYKHIDSRNWDDVPVLDKSSLRKDIDNHINPDISKERLWLRPTSGTSGPAFTVYYSPKFFVQMQLIDICKVAWLAHIYDKDFRSRSTVCLALQDKKHLTNRVWGPPDGSTGLTVRPVFDESSAESVGKLILLLEECRPAILSLKPNILQHLVERSSSRLRTAMQSVRAIVSGGADLADGLRLTSNSELGVPTINVYGLSELGIIGSECDLCRGFHVYPNVIIEVLTGGRVLPSGVGELLVSSSANEAMPLLRYRTGDIGEIAVVNCACGKKGKQIVQLSGRSVPNFRLPDGSEFAPTALDALTRLFPLEDFQITQTETDLIEVGLEFPSSCDSQEVSRQVQLFVRRQMRDLVRVFVVPMSRGLDSKFQRYRTLV